jgi:hypothetical protein
MHFLHTLSGIDFINKQNEKNGQFNKGLYRT